MRGLVSFSLFGDDPNDVYFAGAVKNAQRYRQIFPEWDLWFYTGRSVPDTVLRDIRGENPRVSFEFVDEIEDQTSTWWRFRALHHSDHDFIVFRDTDSRPFLREVMAVDEWLSSPWPYHAIRDHQYHGRPLLAGLWGIKKSHYHHHRKMPLSISGDYYGTDQIELGNFVWPVCRRQILAHIGCYHIFEKIDQRRPLTVSRTDQEPFCAQGLDADDNPRYPEHTPMVDTDLDLRKPSDGRPDIFLEEYRVQGTFATPVFARRAKENLFRAMADEG